VAARDQRLGEMTADEARAAGDENLERFQCRSLLADVAARQDTKKTAGVGL
jgi:hypothetical protein